MKQTWRLKIAAVLFLLVMAGLVSLRYAARARAQMPDRTRNPNVANFGIAKSLADEITVNFKEVLTPSGEMFTANWGIKHTHAAVVEKCRFTANRFPLKYFLPHR